MSGYRRWFTAGGALAVLIGLGITVSSAGSKQSGEFTGIATFVAFVGAIGALWKVAGTADDEGVASAPWTESGALFEQAPERSRSDPTLSGAALADVIEAAGETAREERTIEDGLAVVRPELRDALTAALGRGGADRERVETALADGSWTDDRVAAAVLEADVVPPDRPLRRRVNEWLFPERAVLRRTRHAVQAIAEASDDALPTVVGQRAPRNVPVLPPTLENLQRAGDGTLSPAIDPTVVTRGPGPTTPELSADTDDERPAVDGEDTTEATDTQSTEVGQPGGGTVGAR